MLVLTRRENERIIFPEVGITVELVAINGSRARIGVDAPAEVGDEVERDRRLVAWADQ